MHVCVIIFEFCTVFTGRFDLLDSSTKCLNCGATCSEESPVRSYITRGYWPGFPTQKGRYIYDESLFELYDILQKQSPGLSESGFLKSLECFSEAKGRVSYSFNISSRMICMTLRPIHAIVYVP